MVKHCKRTFGENIEKIKQNISNVTDRKKIVK